jgi:putative DNA primase/helicase
MTALEAVRIAPAGAESGPATQLLALYAEGTDEAVGFAAKLTLAMIAETAVWPKAAAEKVRGWWVKQVRELWDEEDAEEFDWRWAEARQTQARRQDFKAQLAARIGPETNEVEDDLGPPEKIKAAPSVSGETKSSVEAPKAVVASLEMEDVAPPLLSKVAPMDNARAFARDRLWKDGALATYQHHGDWWQWNGRFYERAPAERISGAVYQYLDRALVRTRDGEERFRPKPEHAEALVKCLKACAAIDDRDAPPRWLDQRSSPPAENLLVFNNCLVDAETGEIAELTPQLWAHDGVDFDFAPDARCPRWERFLEEVFPGDGESQLTIEEQLGYGMTYDTRFEKGALWVGQKRSGKSTLAWVQERLVGERGYASLNFHDWMKTENSRAHLVGKKVGVFPDVRLRPARNYGLTGYDPGGIDHQSAQLLLQIIGRDTIAIGRKFRDAWQGRLTVKVIITTNEVPNLQDAGGVLASRFIMLDFKESFFGREDVNLRDQLEAELPGIANRCLAAYRRLRSRGRFIQPRSGLALAEKIAAKVNPFAAFMADCFVEDPEGRGILIAEFLEIFQGWCRDNRRHDLISSTTKQNLIQEVNKIERWKHLRSVRPHGEARRYLVARRRKADA